MNRSHNIYFTTRFFIRFFDLFFAFTALIFFTPLLILVAITLRFSGEGEVFFRQTRVGKGKKSFNLLKFATMLKESPTFGTGELTLPNDPRVLPFGRFLRKTKINELPQLFNVVVGDLSLIGPRPQTLKYFNLYLPDDRVFIEKIKPGLSGVGSILFRNEESLLKEENDPISFDNYILTPYKGKLEHWYSLNINLTLYFGLIFTTILVVFIPRLGLRKKLMKKLPVPPAELKILVDSNNETCN